MIQWYNKSLCNWSCSFPDMSILFLMGLLFPYLWFVLFSPPKQENKSCNQKANDRQKPPGCIPVWLPIHSHNRERERDTEKGQGIKEIHMFWRLVRDGKGLQFLFLFSPRWVETEKHKDIFCTFRNSDSRPSGFPEVYFHSCVLRVWPDPAAAHPPMAEGWLKAICPPFRANPDICWLTWRCQDGKQQNNNITAQQICYFTLVNTSVTKVYWKKKSLCRCWHTWPMFHWACGPGCMAYIPWAGIIPAGMAPPCGPIILGAMPITPVAGAFPMKPLGMVIPTIMPGLGPIMAAPPGAIMAPMTVVDGRAAPMPAKAW